MKASTSATSLFKRQILLSIFTSVNIVYPCCQADLVMQALRSDNAQMKTSNALIEAQSILSTCSLVLSTSNAPISGFITLLDTRSGASLNMTTSNGSVYLPPQTSSY